MGLFDGLIQHIKGRPDGNAEPLLDALVSYQTSDPGVFVGAGALTNSDIWSAVFKISRDVASNPLKYSGDNTSAGKHILSLVSQSPAPGVDAFSFWQALTVLMLLNGNSFALIIRNDSGTPRELRLIPNNRMTVKQDDQTGVISYWLDDKKKIAATNMLHFKIFSQDGVKGISPLFALRDQMNVQQNKNALLRQFFDHGMTGTGILTVHNSDLDSKAKATIRTKFERANGGAINTLVLDDSMDYKQLPLNLDVLKLANAVDWTTRQIAAAFGLPVEALGLESEHSNSEQSSVKYLQSTLVGYFSAITSQLNLKLATLGNSFAFDTSSFFTADPATTYSMYENAVQAGLLTKNEARAKLGLPPLPQSTNQDDNKNGSGAQSELTEPKESEDNQVNEQQSE